MIAGRMYVMVSVMAMMSASLSSQVAEPVRPSGPGKAPESSTKTDQALINGTAVDTSAVRLPNASIRLRNLVSNQIEQVATSNQMGEFTFVARPEVPYVVEVADKAGRIVAVSDIITAQAGDVAAAAITIPARLPALAGLFSNSAGTVLTAAMSSGILDPPPPLSPEK